MSWLKKLFGSSSSREETLTEPDASADVKPTEGTPAATAPTSLSGPFAGLEGIRFGRYSDNNKTYAKTQSWYVAEDRFKEKRYAESFAAIFDYMRDEGEDNVHFRPSNGPAPSADSGQSFQFEILQGSKRITGEGNGQRISARVPLANMKAPSVAVMRRLLDLNYSLYYSRTAMDEDSTLYMLFDTEVTSANPTKLYYGLRELATKADRQDDLLIADFSSLAPADVDHVQRLPAAELDTKYKWFRKWIEDGLKRAEELNQDSFSGAIAYLLLTIVYRIDFLIVPEAKLLAELERINGIYWEKKDEVALVERNQRMKEAIQKLLSWTKEQFAASVYRAKSTFAIATPPKMDKVIETVNSSNKDSRWYIDNKHPDLALSLSEYGVLHNQFIYSMPRVMTELTQIYMAVLHPDYFAALGMSRKLYDPLIDRFERDLIVRLVDEAIARVKDKYINIQWEHSRVKYTSQHEFATSFSDQMVGLKLDTKR